MTEDQFADVVRDALEHAWGRALDVSQSDDFRHEDGSLDEDAYLRARAMILEHLAAKILGARRTLR